MCSEAIYLERINAMACRNYRGLSGARQYEFNTNLTQLLGESGAGGTTILDILTLTFEPKLMYDTNQDSTTHSVIELDFFADGKRHLLYWSFSGLETLEATLSIENCETYDTITSQDALDYLNRITKPHRIGEGCYSKFNFLNSKDFENMNPEKLERLLILINSWLIYSQNNFNYLFLKKGVINVTLGESAYVLGDCCETLRVKVSDLLVLANICEKLDSNKIAKVVLLDDIHTSPYIELMDVITLLTKKHQVQFITTARINGQIPVKIDLPILPNQYRSEDEKVLENTDKFRWGKVW
jgi:hypothetical protein